ncbi:unnamed protein product [Didymodactylos carnosus]|uniref:Uncharacterized protein n=1 Tax=Didymodactylos carnosus TaxID=1234261 RepID=A0A814XS89_9BILA|nr:unnamed protein product [Didymodactylos carnosus]CAF3983206.1 unnamed protein product [Didymodactylos carnosus]
MIIKYIVYAFIITTTILATSTSLPKNDDLLSLNEHEAKDYLHEEKPHPSKYMLLVVLYKPKAITSKTVLTTVYSTD